MTVAGYFLRGKRQLSLMLSEPGVELGCKIIVYCGGGLLLAAIPALGGPVPLAAALAAASPGLWPLAAALGAGAGYFCFFGLGPGMLWTAAGLLTAFVLRAAGERRPEWAGVCFSLLAGGTGCFFTLQPRALLLWAGLAGVGALLFGWLHTTQHPLALWLTFGLGVRALAAAGLAPLAFGAVGILAASGPLPAAMLAGAGLEWAGMPGMTAGLGLGWLCRTVPMKEPWRRMPGPALGCILGMALGRSWNIGAWLGVSTGGILGAMIPWSFLLPPGTRGISGAQVRLEQAAEVLGQMQQRLLEIPARPGAVPDRVEQVKSLACADCPRAAECGQRARMDEGIFLDPLSFSCAWTARVLREAGYVRERERLLDAEHRRREEYRMAVAQQYGMLSRYMRRVADGLPLRLTVGQIRYRVSVSVRSRQREQVDGDRCAAFPGPGPRFYVLLCDGMGTGAPAAREAAEAVDLLKGMLTAGLPPTYALRSLNAQLLLTGESGAVTADLAEIRLDTGYASLYKWGAAPSWLLTRHRARPIGKPGLPPGVELGEGGARIARLSLRRGENLVLVSDGVTFTPPLTPEETIRPPGELANILLRQGTQETQDDATLALIRLSPVCHGSGT